MKFIGRENELLTLKNEYERDGGFVVLYGRRRVGKTTLIKEFIRGRRALYFLATEEIERQNIRRFAGAVADFTGQDFIRHANFPHWEDLFKLLAAHRPGGDGKKILVIDEFQYLVALNPAFPSIFQRAWDEYLKESGTMVILCGSLISMMTAKALSYQSPLYGRRTAQMRLRPFRFSELLSEFGGGQGGTGEAFGDLVELYAVTGGVPKYLEFFENEKPLFTNIRETIFNKSGFLYEEPLFLLAREVREPVSYFSIIKCVADGNRKPSQIGSVLEKSSQELAPYLSTLIELGLLEKRVPVTEKNPEKSRKGLYHISDCFLDFWFKFVFPHRAELELDNTEPAAEALERGFASRHAAFVYGDICRDILAKLSETGQLGFRPLKIGSFWDANIEIDVMAADGEGRGIFAGECKYRNTPVDTDVYSDLRRKCANIAGLDPENLRCGIFSKSGFTDRLIALARTDERLLLIKGGCVV